VFDAILIQVVFTQNGHDFVVQMNLYGTRLLHDLLQFHPNISLGTWASPHS
jgi:hypothetical protein